MHRVTYLLLPASMSLATLSYYYLQYKDATPSLSVDSHALEASLCVCVCVCVQCDDLSGCWSVVDTAALFRH